MKTFLKYAAAFVAGCATPLIPKLLGGAWPSYPALLGAFLTGLLATGLFHVIPPRAQAIIDSQTGPPSP